MKPSILTTRFLFLLMMSLLLQSCSIHLEKRRYNPGYHVEMIRKLNVEGHTSYKENNQVRHTQHKAELISNDSLFLPVDAPDLLQVERKISYPKEMLKPGGSDCDIAFLKNGKTFFCTYIQMTDVIFTYKICDGKTTDVKSMDITKVEYVVLNQGDTIYPAAKIDEWLKEHAPTDPKLKKQLLKRGEGTSKTTAVFLYLFFGILAIGGGVPLLIWSLTGLGLWIFLGGIFLIILAGALVIGGIALIILAIITAAMK